MLEITGGRRGRDTGRGSRHISLYCVEHRPDRRAEETQLTILMSGTVAGPVTVTSSHLILFIIFYFQPRIVARLKRLQLKARQLVKSRCEYKEA